MVVGLMCFYHPSRNHDLWPDHCNLQSRCSRCLTSKVLFIVSGISAFNGIVPFCAITKWQCAILCNHKFPKLTSMVFCAITKWQCAILCNHKMAMCHFVQSQKCKIHFFWMNLKIAKEGGTLANFFRQLFCKLSSKTDQIWISVVGPHGKPSNSHHFFNMLDHYFLASI